MKKMCAVSVMGVVLCFGLHASQVLGSDNDRAQLDALNKKDEARSKRESLEGKVVSPANPSYQEKSALERWKEAYDKEQERIKRGYEG